MIKIAALGDLHMQTSLIGYYKPIFETISQEAEVLLLCGDLTDHGSVEEAKLLVEELSTCSIPILGVLGNHEFTHNHQEKIRKVICPKPITLLDNDSQVIKGVGFAGVKGFLGGFDNHMLGIHGEEVLRNIVYEAINEALKLEDNLSILDTEKKVVIMHYSPIKQTVIGEPTELYPFLGSSRLAGPIDRFEVTAVFHGHAHHGQAEGKTAKGIPVYNVSVPVRKKIDANKPYLIVEI